MSKIIIPYLGMILICSIFTALIPSLMVTVAICGLITMFAALLTPTIALSGSLVSLIVFILFGVKLEQAFVMTAMFFLTGTVMGYCIKTKKSYKVAILSGSVLYLLCNYAMYRIAALKDGISIADFFAGSSLELAGAQLKESMPDVDYTVVISQVSDFIVKTLPAYFFITAIITVFLAFSFARYMLKRVGANIEMDFFHDLKMDAVISISLIVMTALSFVKGIPNDLVLNASLVLLFLVCASGVALLDFWMIKGNIKKPYRLLIFIFLFALSFLILPVVMIAILGICDSFLNFRGRKLENTQ